MLKQSLFSTCPLSGLLVASGLLVLSFQNCSSGMQPHNEVSQSSILASTNIQDMTPGQGVALDLDQVLSYMDSPKLDSQTTYLYVDPRLGSDANGGTIDKPLQTFAGAKGRVRTLAATAKGHIVVNFRTGRYELADTLVFTPEDSGPAPYSVIYQSYPGERSVVSGGIREAANKYVWSAMGNGVYRTNIGANRPIRQLYIRNRPVPRARGTFLAQPTFQLTDQGVILPAYTGKAWAYPKALEVVVLFAWRMFRCPVEEVSDAHFIFEKKCLQNVTGMAYNLEIANNPNLSAIWIENAPELITQSEEWAYDYSTGNLFFRPQNSSDLSSTELVLTFPHHMHLMRIEGESKAVSGLVFRGLEFSHSAWGGPSEAGGYSSFQSGYHKIKDPSGRLSPLYLEPRSGPYGPLDPQGLLYRIPAAIEVRGGERLAFIGNKFQLLGGTGLFLGAGSSNNRISFNQFLDIGATSLQVGSINTADPAISDSLRVRDNVIEGNEFSRAARDYYDNVGIFVGYTQGTRILRNHLYQLPYSGISIGYKWHSDPTSSQGLNVSQNYIHNVMTWLADGGGIYTLGSHADSVVELNQIRDVVFSPFYVSTLPFVGGLYFDNGTRGFRVTRNQVLNIEHNMWLLELCVKDFGSSCHRNYFLNRSLTADPATSGIPTIESNNVYGNYRALTSALSPAGQVKVDYGVQSAYRDILNREPTSLEGMQCTQDLMYGKTTLGRVRQKLAESDEAIQLLRQTPYSDTQLAAAQKHMIRGGSLGSLSGFISQFNATSALGDPQAILSVDNSTSYDGFADRTLELRWSTVNSSVVDMRASLLNSSSNCELASFQKQTWFDGNLPEGDRQLLHFGPEYRACDMAICVSATNANRSAQSCVSLHFR